MNDGLEIKFLNFLGKVKIIGEPGIAQFFGEVHHIFCQFFRIEQRKVVALLDDQRDEHRNDSGYRKNEKDHYQNHRKDLGHF